MIAFISVYNTAEPERSMYERFLYNLLEQRREYQNISHKKMPTYSNHVKLIRSEPHKHWFIVQNSNNRLIGSVYVSKQDEIGIFLKEEYTHQGYGTKILNEIFEYCKDIKEFKANIAPFNSASLCFFVNRGFIYNSSIWEDTIFKQYTYKKINPCYNEIIS